MRHFAGINRKKTGIFNRIKAAMKRFDSRQIVSEGLTDLVRPCQKDWLISSNRLLTETESNVSSSTLIIFFPHSGYTINVTFLVNRLVIFCLGH